jgi:hypothetical protein
LFRLFISSKDLADAILELCPFYAPNKTFECSFPLIHRCKWDFLRGYHDGDGWITKNGQFGDRKRPQLAWGLCGTRQFLEEVMDIMVEDLGVNYVTPRRISGPCWSFVYAGNEQVPLIMKKLHHNRTFDSPNWTKYVHYCRRLGINPE